MQSKALLPVALFERDDARVGKELLISNRNTRPFAETFGAHQQERYEMVHSQAHSLARMKSQQPVSGLQKRFSPEPPCSIPRDPAVRVLQERAIDQCAPKQGLGVEPKLLKGVQQGQDPRCRDRELSSSVGVSRQTVMILRLEM